MSNEPSTMSHEEQEIHLKDYALVIRRRKWILIVSFIVTLTLVTFHTFRATPVYQAATQVKIDRENPNVLSFEEVLAIDSQDLMFYQTQYKILASRSLALRVINALNLKDNPEFKPDEKSGGFSIRSFLDSLALRALNALNLKDNPEFKSDENEEGSQLYNEGEYGEAISKSTDAQLHLPESDSLNFKIRSFLGSLIKRVSKRPDEGVQKEEDAGESGLIDSYLGRLKIEQIRGSRLVNIKFTGVHPEEIKKIVNMHASEYIDSNHEARFAASNNAVEWLHKQILTKKELVEKAENTLQIYKEEKKIVSLEDKQNIIVQKLEDLNSKLTDARTERMKLETLNNLTKKYAGKQGMLETIPEIMENDLISELKNEHVSLLTEIKRLSKRYGKNHPAMIRAVTKAEELKIKIDEEVVKLAKSIETKYKVALSQEESLSKALEDQKEVALQLNRDAIAYNTLKREIEGERAMYEILLKRLKETDVTSELQTSNIRIIDSAETPGTPIKPRKKRNVLLGSVLGLFIGIGLAFFLEYLDNTIKRPEDVEQYLGIPLLGIIEKIRTKVNSPELITQEFPKSVIAEAVRSIRTSVIFSMIDKPRKLIMVTSAVQGEGKTFMASNLAYTIAQTGKNTLLVDTDLRKPRLNEVFSVTRKPGLSNHLIGECDLESIVKTTSVPNLSIITCGIIPPNPSEILESTLMEKFCKEVRDKFDIVIFDTPPSMTVTDAIVLSRNIDGVIVTIRSGSTVKNTVKRCISQFTSSKCEILGAIVNYADIVKGGYYYHYYAHYYKYGYSSEEEVQEAESVCSSSQVHDSKIQGLPEKPALRKPKSISKGRRKKRSKGRRKNRIV